MAIRGVIFDLDGTLVHTIEDIAGAANAMLRKRGFHEHDVQRYLEWIGSGAAKLIERAIGTPVPDTELRECVAEFKEAYGQNLHDRSRVYDGISGVLDALEESGLRMAVLSNKPHLLTERVVDYYLSGRPFHPVFGQREEVPRKPDPAAALEIAGTLGLEPGQVMFVGDSENDILTAEAAGMVPVGVVWGYGRLGSGEWEGRCPLLEYPWQLAELINNMNAET